MNWQWNTIELWMLQLVWDENSICKHFDEIRNNASSMSYELERSQLKYTHTHHHTHTTHTHIPYCTMCNCAICAIDKCKCAQYLLRTSPSFEKKNRWNRAWARLQMKHHIAFVLCVWVWFRFSLFSFSVQTIQSKQSRQQHSRCIPLNWIIVIHWVFVFESSCVQVLILPATLCSRTIVEIDQMRYYAIHGEFSLLRYVLV